MNETPRPGAVTVLTDALDDALDEAGRTWLRATSARVAVEPGSVLTAFPAVGRRCGRGPLPQPQPVPLPLPLPDLTGWTVDEAARTVLLTSVPAARAAELATAAYRQGDAAERRAVLRALALLDLGEAALPLLEDALRTNDSTLVAAALGPAAARLDDHGWRQGVLKCFFLGVPATVADGLDERADAELARMLLDFAHERVAAGRDVPADLWPLVTGHPELVAASGIEAELDSDVPTRAAAARRALSAMRAEAPHARAEHSPAGPPPSGRPPSEHSPAVG